MREWEMSHRHIHVFCECDYIDDYQIWKASRSSASQEVRLDLTNREEPRCSKLLLGSHPSKYTSFVKRRLPGGFILVVLLRLPLSET